MAQTKIINFEYLYVQIVATNNTTLQSILDKEKLNGTNFLDWHRNLRIVLKHETKLYMIDQPIPNEPAASAPRAEKNAYSKHKEDSLDVTCIMLATMDPELQKQMEDMEAYDMIVHLRECSKASKTSQKN